MVGVAAMMTNDICVYRDTSLSDMNITALNYNAGIDSVTNNVIVDTGDDDETTGG